MALERDFYLKEPLLEMPITSRKAVSYIVSIWTVILTAAAVTFIISGTDKLIWPGLLLTLYLAHRFFHLNGSEKSLAKLPTEGRINVAQYLSRGARNALVTATDRATLFGGSFLLYLAKDLINTKEAVEALESTNAQLLNAKTNSVMQRFTILAFLTFPLVLTTALFTVPAIDEAIDRSLGMFLSIFGLVLLSTSLMLYFFRKKGWI